MRNLISSFAVAGFVMAFIDAVWLSLIANKFYKSQIGPLLLDKPNLVAAAAFYLIYVAGIVAFAVLPALDRNAWQHALGYGALLGLVAYATYDLTNLATLKGFPLKVVVVDLIWGVILTATVSLITYFIVKTWV